MAIKCPFVASPTHTHFFKVYSFSLAKLSTLISQALHFHVVYLSVRTCKLRSGKSIHISMISNCYATAESYQHRNRQKLRTSTDIAVPSADVATSSTNVTVPSANGTVPSADVPVPSADIGASKGECSYDVSQCFKSVS